MGVCTDNCNVFVTGPQTRCVKILTTITATVTYLKHLGKLFRAFSVHLKETVPRLSIAEALQEVGDLKRFPEGTGSTIQTIIDSQKASNGSDGTISKLSLKSVQMMYNQLNRLDDKLKSTKEDIHVDLHACLTTQVENLHAVGHFKDH